MGKAIGAIFQLLVLWATRYFEQDARKRKAKDKLAADFTLAIQMNDLSTITRLADKARRLK